MASAAPTLHDPVTARRNLRVGLMAFAGALAMLGLGYAAVPLYRLFCQVTITIGERDIATYVARNSGSTPITGMATFNVEPEQAGKYFNKIQCFCFTEQTLAPGQEVTMPVLYYVDPAMLDDPNMKGVEQITLSYTFHRASGPKAAAPAGTN